MGQLKQIMLTETDDTLAFHNCSFIMVSQTEGREFKPMLAPLIFSKFKMA